MKIETTPWYETRTLISPRIEMLESEGMALHKKSFLKSEAPATATPKYRFIHYDVNYVKYWFLKEFYSIFFDCARENLKQNSSEDILAELFSEVATQFIEYCREQPSEESDRELFRAFCKTHLY